MAENESGIWNFLFGKKNNPEEPRRNPSKPKGSGREVFFANPGGITTKPTRPVRSPAPPESNNPTQAGDVSPIADSVPLEVGDTVAEYREEAARDEGVAEERNDAAAARLADQVEDIEEGSDLGDVEAPGGNQVEDIEEGGGFDAGEDGNPD